MSQEDKEAAELEARIIIAASRIEAAAKREAE